MHWKSNWLILSHFCLQIRMFLKTNWLGISQFDYLFFSVWKQVVQTKLNSKGLNQPAYPHNQIRDFTILTLHVLPLSNLRAHKGDCRSTSQTQSMVWIFILSRGWMDDLPLYVLFDSISFISGRWKVDNERLCAMKLRLRLRRFRHKRGSNSFLAVFFYVYGKIFYTLLRQNWK